MELRFNTSIMNKRNITLVVFLLFSILTNPSKENLESKLKIETTRTGVNSSEIEISRSNYLFFSTYNCMILIYDKHEYPKKKYVYQKFKYSYVGFVGTYW